MIESLQTVEGSSPAQARLKGERRVITAVIADVKGSTGLSEEMDVETWVEIMNHVFQILEAEVYRFGGEVDQFRGDCVVAFFGTPVVHEDDPERAVLAALAMQDKLHLYAAELAERREAARERPIQLLMRVGVNTGEVIAARVGSSHQHSEDTAMGRAIAVAARMEAAAEPGTVLVAQDTYRLVEPLFTWQVLGETAIKGLSQPIRAYRPLAHCAIPGKGRGVAGLSSPLIGRHAEFRALQEALQRLCSGAGGIVTLVGEAGIGKSRLVAEVRKSPSLNSTNLRSVDLQWIEGRCLSYAGGIAYQLWLDMLHELLGVPPGATTATVQDALRAKVRALCPDRFDRVYPYLCRLMALPLGREYEALCDLRGESLRAEVFRAAEVLIESAARGRPLVIVCEDLHWADTISLALLDRLLALLDRVPVLFICVFRPHATHGCWRIVETAARHYRHRYVDLRLDPLSALDSAALVDNLLRIQDLPPTLRSTILDHAEGNPFYVEEIVRSLINAGAIAQDSATGRWRATREVTDLALPDTLNGVLMARIDRLPPEAKRVLQLASVLGRIFAPLVLAEIAAVRGGPEEEKPIPSAAPRGRVSPEPSSGVADRRTLNAHLLTLEGAQLIRRRARLPEPEYIFKHELTREAAYNSLLRRERRVIHRRVAEALEQVYPDRVEEQLGVLAHHWERAGDREQAVEYLLRAGEQARAAYANEEALTYYRRALALLEEAILSASEKQWRLTALSGIGRVQFGVGKVDESESPLREAIALSQQIGLAPRELVRLYYWLGEVLYWQGRNEYLCQIGHQGLALLGRDSESVEAALMNSHIAIACEMQGNWHKARQYLSRTMRFVQRLPYTEELRPTYDRLFQMCIHDKDVAGALWWNQALEEQASAYHDLRALAEVHYHSADLLRHRGDFYGAATRYRQALDLFTRIEDAKHAGWCLQSLSQVYLDQGDLDRAQAYARRFLEASEAVGFTRDVVMAHDQIGLIAFCKGDLAQAEKALQRALSLSKVESPFRELSTSFLLAQVYLAQGNYAGALERLQAVEDVVQKSHLFVREPYVLLLTLGALEAAYQDAKAFRSACRRLEKEYSDTVPPSFVQWYLEPATVGVQTDLSGPPDLLGPADLLDPPAPLQGDLTGGLAAGWTWHDPFGDCVYTATSGIEIRAVNGRDLVHINQSAPRLLRTVAGDWVVQTVCVPVSENTPALGGLLLWADERNYLRLDRGVLGERQISFMGCLKNKEVAIGQGGLPVEDSGRVYLRLERAAAQVCALCSADGENWFTVGRASFPDEGSVQVGMHAIGSILRWVYPGAHSEGTAIRFESFQLQ